MLFMARRTAPLTTHCPPLTDHCLLLTTYCLLTTDTASHACSLAPALPAASQRNCKSLMFRKHRWVGAKRRAAPDGALIDLLGTDAHRRGGLCQVRGVEAGHGRAVTRIAPTSDSKRCDERAPTCLPIILRRRFQAVFFNKDSSELQRPRKSLCLLRNWFAPNAAYSSVSPGLIVVEYITTGTD